MRKILSILFIVVILLGGVSKIQAEEPATVNLTIRDGSTVVFSGPVPLQPAGTISLSDIDGAPHDIDANSVLAVVHDADLLSDEFEISNLTYFSSFGSLYIKCITDSVGESCDNWQYVVNDSYPFVGMDQNILSGGESVFLYFGPQNKILLSSNSINTSDTLMVTAQAYDYQNDGWIARTGVTVGLTQPNPSDPFSPIEITTSGVDTNGVANFLSIAEGSYNVGVKEDFYFPTEALTVTAPVPPPSSGGGGSSKKKSGAVLGATTKIKFDTTKAFNYLVGEQKENGSFGEEMYTDWTALAFASSPLYKEETIKLVKHFSESKLSGTLLTDYERHAMALMALGLNPYNTNGENYINKIVSEFDGKQFGDIVEDNDDIFALIVLQNAGFKVDEKMIADDIAFILSKQKENGSWDESVDMTGAGMEALAFLSENEQAKNALAKAKGFLKKNQKEVGGWGNVSSTAWAIGGILALKEAPEDWAKNDPAKDGASNTPLDYLVENQDIDGGMKNENIKNKVWETAYTLTALSGKTWSEIMQKFEKPKEGIVLGASLEVKPATEPVPAKKIVKKLPPETPKELKTKNVIEENNLPQPEPEKEIKKENWFMRLIHFIF